MHSVTNTARTLQNVLLGYVADALGAPADATSIPGRGMTADTLLLTSPAVVLSVTCVSPPMFRSKALRLARDEAIDVVLIRCCLTPLGVLPVAIDVVLAGGGLAPFVLYDLAFYRHDDGVLWLAPEGFGAAIRLGTDGLELHLTPPYDALSERAGGIYRATAELAGMLYPARPR